MKSITLTEKRFFEWHEDDKSVTLRNNGGSYGGVRGTRYLLYQETVGALCATDYKWVQQEQVMQGKLLICVKRQNETKLGRDTDGNDPHREECRGGSTNAR